MKIPEDVALIVVDVQRDFLPGGALPVSNGHYIIPVVNRLIAAFGDKVVFTLDSHPLNHKSFASNNPGMNPFDADEDGHVMWPDHCVLGTWGRSHPEALKVPRDAVTVQKGVDPDHDSYSGFKDDGGQSTALIAHLRAWNTRRLVICGLATDYCVLATALDARAYGYHTVIAIDGCRGIDAKPGDVEKAYDSMARAGIVFAGVEQIVNPTGFRILARSFYDED